MRNNKNRGITLIALVVTIIILIILAAITINMLIGTNGILKRAGEGAEGWKTEEEREKTILADLEEYVDDKTTPEPKVIDGIYTDGDKVAPVPEGFDLIKEDGNKTTKIDEGLVIADEYENEFVWVPVPNVVLEIPVGRTEIQIEALVKEQIEQEKYPMALKVVGETDYRGILYDTWAKEGKVQISYKDIRSYPMCYYEPDVLRNATSGDTDSNLTLAGLEVTQSQFEIQLQNEYNDMVKSVKDNGGFYIGRYETSLNGVTGAVQSMKNQVPMSARVDSGNKWWGMYAKQKTYDSDNQMTSGMIWGSQWDQVMIWMKDIKNTNQIAKDNPFYVIDSREMGWYDGNYNTGNPTHTTGKPVGDNENRVKNIFDMAGNMYDYTMEGAYDGYRAIRGRNL